MSSALHLRVVLALVLLAGCGGGTASGDGGASGSALVGTWGNTTCYAFCTAPDCGTCDNAITFSADGRYAGTSSFVNSTSNTSYPGCTITTAYTGYTWSATASTFDVVVGASAGETVARAGCMNASDEQPATPEPTFDPANLAFSGAPYAITGATLTLGTGASAVTYTRR